MAESQYSWEVPEGAKSSYERWGEGAPIPVIKTFFVDDTRKIQLEWWERYGGNSAFVQMEYNLRGAGGSNIKFELSENTTTCHISEFPVETYKTAHHHGAGAHVMMLGVEGYSLIWPDDAPIKKYDWHEDSMVVLPENWWHQHFNGGDRPARYLALRAFGNKKYKGVGRKYQPSLDRKKGGSQIEYADEEQIIRDWFNEAMVKGGVPSLMAKQYEKKQ